MSWWSICAAVRPCRPPWRALKRQHPTTPVLLVTSSLEPAIVLEAMRAGVNECVAEPLQAAEIETAVTRLLAHKQPVATGQVFAFIGAKGGVGTTTVAVNVATELDRAAARPHAARRPAPGARRRRRLPRRRAALLGRRRPRQHPSLRRRVLQGPGRAVAGRPAPAGVVRPAAGADQQRAARAQPGRVRGQPLPLHRARRAALRCRRPGRARSGVADRRRRQPGAGDGAQRQPDRGGAAPALRQRHASR